MKHKCNVDNVDDVYNIVCTFCTDFQNYIRTQAGNTTTVNLVICTVDFLLRIQVGSEMGYCKIAL